MWLFLGLVAAGALALVFVWIYVVAPAVSRQHAADLAQSRWRTTGLERVAWAAGGRYAVIQDFRPDGVPQIAVWDRVTHTSRVATGCVLLRVDPAGPFLFAERMGPLRVSELSVPAASYPLSGTVVFDAPPAELTSWDLSAPGVTWSVPVPGEPLGSRIGDVYGSIEASRGSGYARFAWWPRGRARSGPALRTPPGTTWRALGWSASGRYFAAEELVPAPATLPAVAPPRRLLAFWPPAPWPVATAVLPAGATASWDSAEDRLVWVRPGAGAATVDALGVSGARPRASAPAIAATASTPLSTPDNSGLTPLWFSPYALGATTFWQLKGGALAKAFNVPLDGKSWAWNDRAGLLVNAPETGLGTYRTVVYYLSPKGGTPSVIYTGERRSDSKGSR